jgi:hypothetical protein
MPCDGLNFNPVNLLDNKLMRPMLQGNQIPAIDGQFLHKRNHTSGRNHSTTSTSGLEGFPNSRSRLDLHQDPRQSRQPQSQPGIELETEAERHRNHSHRSRIHVNISLTAEHHSLKMFRSTCRTAVFTARVSLSTSSRRAFQSCTPFKVAVGDQIPEIDLVEDSPGNKVSLAEELASGHGVIIGVPAAFSVSRPLYPVLYQN